MVRRRIFLSNYGILRLQKYDGGAVRGIDTHVQRRATRSRTNPDIDFAKSNQNYDLQSQYQGTFYSRIKNVLKREGIGKTRKNAVVLAELLFTASPSFFDKMSDNEIRQYFQDCYDWAVKNYGESNIISAVVHMDEKTPHLHLELVPIKDGKLNARGLFNYKTTEMQNSIHKDVFQKYGLDRGDTTRKLKHISTLNYKALTLQTEIDKKKQELATLDNSQLYRMKKHIQELTARLNEMMSVIESDKDLMSEYIKARNRYFKDKNNEREI